MGGARATEGDVKRHARIAATRSNLLRARAQLDRVRKGADIVRKKRQALVTHLFRIARPAADSRAEIARQVSLAYPQLLEALAVNGRDGLRAIAGPARQIEVDVRPVQVWGVPVADIEPIAPLRRTLDARGTPPGSTGPAAQAAADAFEALTELLVKAAPNELRVARLADAVSLTSQQLQVLEERVQPDLLSRIADVRRTLEEREREEHLLLKHLQRRRADQQMRGN